MRGTYIFSLKIFFFAIFSLYLKANNDNDFFRRVVETNIVMNDSINAEIGNIVKNSILFIHNLGKNEKGEYTNTFVGKDAGGANTRITGNQNVGLGSNALINVTVRSKDNTAIGANTLFNTTTNQSNTAIGAFALANDNSTSESVAIGASAMERNDAGKNNTAIGSNALNMQQNASGNIAIGQNALTPFGPSKNINDNIALGKNSLVLNQQSGNIAIGYQALGNNVDGGNSIAIGNSALQKGFDNSKNIAIGDGSNVNGASADNITIGRLSGSALVATSGPDFNNENIMIGNIGVAGDASTIRIGSTQFPTFIAGINGRPITTGIPVLIDDKGQLGVNTASRKYKNSIRAMNNGDSSCVHNLEPVTFVYNKDITKTMHYGLIAEEVDKVFPALVIRDENGEPLSVRYEILPVLLLNELQLQKQEMNQLKQDMNELPDLLQAITRLQEKWYHFMTS